MHYDPDDPPAPDVWRALDEDEAQSLIARYHRSARCDHPPAPGRHLHDLMHFVVETQAARLDEMPIADVLTRLVAEGLTRHEAVHAVGSVLSRYLSDASRTDGRPSDVDHYYEEVRVLTAESWRHASIARSDPDRSLGMLTDDALVDLLFTEEDRLPRAAVDEILARGPRLVDALATLVVDPRNWQAPRPQWWATMHATFILAAVPDPACDAPLLSAMRDAEARGNDWISGAMPSILGARGARLRPVLTDIIGDRKELDEVRCRALDGIVASTLVDTEGRDEVLARVGEVFTATGESLWLRTHAAQLLLDFQVRTYEEALMDFARDLLDAGGTDVPNIVAFDVVDVMVAFRESPDLSRYRENCLDFYDAGAIASRQQRWRREAAEAAARARAVHSRPKIGRNDPCT
jgi:hypothetical protein